MNYILEHDNRNTFLSFSIQFMLSFMQSAVIVPSTETIFYCWNVFRIKFAYISDVNMNMNFVNWNSFSQSKALIYVTEQYKYYVAEICKRNNEPHFVCYHHHSQIFIVLLIKKRKMLTKIIMCSAYMHIFICTLNFAAKSIFLLWQIYKIFFTAI